MKSADERSKGVYGVGVASFYAAAEIFGAPVREELENFQREMVVHTVRAVRDVKEEVNINVFWRHLIDAYEVGVFGKGESFRNYFRVTSQRRHHPPGAPNQVATTQHPWVREWVSYRLWINYNPVLELLQAYLAKQRITLPLSRRDLRDQLAKNEYWIAGDYRQRFGTAKAPRRCWCIDVDTHPNGYILVPDEQFFAAGDNVSSNEFSDPRKGELFLLVHEAEKQDEDYYQ